LNWFFFHILVLLNLIITSLQRYIDDLNLTLSEQYLPYCSLFCMHILHTLNVILYNKLADCYTRYPAINHRLFFHRLHLFICYKCISNCSPYCIPYRSVSLLPSSRYRSFQTGKACHHRSYFVFLVSRCTRNPRCNIAPSSSSR
jgi:hypothetical protein